MTRFLKAMAEYVVAHTFKDCRDINKVSEALMADIRKDATEKWGLKILDVSVSDIGECKIIITKGDGGVVVPEE